MQPSCVVNVHVLPGGPIPTNAYLLTEPGLGEAVLVDAPLGVWAQVEPILAAERCRLGMLWLTHGHWDHTQGAAEVVRRSGARTHGHPEDRPLYEHPELMRPLVFPGAVLEPVAIDRWLGDGDRVKALGVAAAVSHVPGHCPGSLMFHFEEAKAAFPGDAIFRGSVGRTDIPGGDFAQLEASIRGRIYVLADDTQLYPGHGGPTTVGAEKATNPYVRA
jgi:glyoxylase-like metal-dependent hydrolase (beta-lactamase superfamily II)